MTLAVETADTSSVAAGGATFALGWSCAASSEVVVTVTPVGEEDPVTKVEGVDYDVVGTLLGGGAEVVFRAGFEPDVGDTVRRYRDTPLEQPDTYGSLGTFDPAKVMRSFDRTIRALQELRRDLGSGGGGGSSGGGMAWADIIGKPTFGALALLDAVAWAAVTGKPAFGALALLDTINNALWSGADLAVTNGGTGASSASAARTNLGLVIGTDVQAQNTVLALLAGIAPANGKIIEFTGAGSLHLVNTPTSIPLDLSTTTLQPAAGAEIQAASLHLNRQLTLLKFIPYALHEDILDHTSTTDVAAYIQEAMDEIEARGGGQVTVEDGLYRIATNIYVPSRLKLMGMGARSIIKSLSGSWAASGKMATGSGNAYCGDGSYRFCMFANKNMDASSLTDEDIILEDVTLDHDGVSYGAGHNWVMRMVDRPQRRFARFLNGGSACPSIATRDSLTLGCHAYNMGGSYFDHWDGFGFAKVIGCTGRNPAGRGIQQGIQFTGMGGYAEARDSLTALSMGNQIYGVRGTGYGPGNLAAALIANGLGAGSSVSSFKSVGDYIEDADIGLVLSGVGGAHECDGLTLKNVTTAPVVIQTDAGTPSNCKIGSIHFIGCTHVGGVAGLVQVEGGSNHSIRGLTIDGGTYSRQVWLGGSVSTTTVHPVDGASGSVTGVDDFGSGNLVRSYGVSGGPYLALSGGTVSGGVSVVGALTAGAASDILLTGRQYNVTNPFYTAGDGADSLGAMVNQMRTALGNLGLIG